MYVCVQAKAQEELQALQSELDEAEAKIDALEAKRNNVDKEARSIRKELDAEVCIYIYIYNNPDILQTYSSL